MELRYGQKEKGVLISIVFLVQVQSKVECKCAQLIRQVGKHFVLVGLSNLQLVDRHLCLVQARRFTRWVVW